MHTTPCAVCGVDFQHKQARTQHCSNHCSAKASYERRRDAGTFSPTHKPVTCVVCGKTWSTKNHLKVRYCSQTCQYVVQYPAHQRRRQPERLRQARRKQQRAARGTVGRTRWTAGNCRVCNTWFVSSHRNITCSDACYSALHGVGHAELKRIHRQTRRARQKSAFVKQVDPAQVFASDGYRCHLCGRKTMKSKQVPHPRAPTVDHVIPLAAGGTHEPTNCRTTKQHLGGGQLLLLAV